jgi:hypothetical protein
MRATCELGARDAFSFLCTWNGICPWYGSRALSRHRPHTTGEPLERWILDEYDMQIYIPNHNCGIASSYRCRVVISIRKYAPKFSGDTVTHIEPVS